MVHLPDEIYLYILQSLPDLISFTQEKGFEDYRQTSILLATICRTSRVLRTFAEPLLYRAYIEEQQDYNQRRSDEAGDCTRLQLFLRTLICRPDLAAKVEYLKLAECLDHPDVKYFPFRELFAKASARFLARYASLPRGEGRLCRNRILIWQDRWKHDLRSVGSHHGAEVALLLTLLPNLGNLDMFISERHIGSHVERLCHNVLGADSWEEVEQVEDGTPISVFKLPQVSSSFQLPMFSRLRTLTLTAWPGTSSLSMDFLRNVICIPSLESLCVDGALTTDAFETPFRLPLQHIRNLTLLECEMADIFLQSLVKSCGSLRSLRIQLPSFMVQLDIHCNLQTLLECFASNSGTLEELEIYIPKASCEQNITPAEAFDLRSFTQLKALEINIGFLVSPNPDSEFSFTALLPTSIQAMYLRMADKRFARHLGVLAQEYKSFPDLKILDISIDGMPDIHAMDQAEVDWKMALEYCTRELRHGGIECEVPVEGTHLNLACGDD